MTAKKIIPLIIMTSGLISILIGSQSKVSKELRSWTLINGQVLKSSGKPIKAEFVSKSSGVNPIITLKLESGKEVRIPKDALSTKDQRFIIPQGRALISFGFLLLLGFWILGACSNGSRSGSGSGSGSCGSSCGGGCGGGCGG